MNNYTVRMLFPSCIHEYIFDGFDKSELINFCYEQREKNPKGQVNSNRGGWHSQYFDIKDDNPISIKLREGLGQSIFTSLEPSLGVEVSYWIMINPSKTYNTSHTHPDSHLSGVMWIESPKNCGDIVFINPGDFSKFVENKSYKQEVVENTSSYMVYRFIPESGKMLTFPASLRHEVKVNESDEDRIAVSYNIRISNVN